MKRKLLSILLTLCLAFSLLPTAALADGEGTQTNDVAQIGGTGYATLQAAIDAAKSGDTIVLKKSISATEIGEKKQLQFVKADMNVTLDLNQNTITAEAGEAIAINAANITLTVKNGTIENFAEGSYSDGVYAYKESNNLTLTFENIVLKSRTQGLAVQGLTSNSNVNIVNSNITSTEGLGIYYPPKSGTLTISDSEITGVTGIVVKGSNLVVNGEKTIISGTGPNVDPETYYTGATDGSSTLTETGDAVYVESGYNDRDISVSISGGHLNSKNAKAVRMFVKNGENTSAKREISVTGGTFSSDVSAYVAKGYVQNENGTVEQLGETNAVAKVGDTYYKTLADAVAAADNNTVTLLKDVTADITIPAGKTMTLDLNGKTLTNVNDHTILNNGNLTITGTGKVDNISHAKGALYNKGTVVINGGTFDRSKENGKDSKDSGANSWYTIKNVGSMTIHDGATVQTAGNNTALGKFSSLVSNGYFNTSDFTNNRGFENPILTIDGGTFRGGLNTIKNDDRAKLTISGGTFSNYYQAVVQNHNIAEITGGTFTAASDANAETYGIYNCGCAADIDLGTLIVSGGTFTGATYAVADVSTQSATVNISNGQFAGTKAAIIKSSTSNATITITGGYFTSDPSAYLAEGKGLVTSDQSAFAYKVGDKATNVETAVTAGEAAVTIPEGVTGITEAAVKNAAKAADTTKTLTDTVAASGMTNDPAVVGTKEAAEAALSAKNISVGSGDTVTVVVQPYLEVNVKSADAGKLTLEISAKYNVVATTGSPVTIDPDKTATLKSGVPLSINKPIELTIVLPTGFAAVNSKIYVQHKGYEYTATVDASGATATFINPHGFSTFTVTSTASAVAEVDGTNYTDLQKAVDAVANNGTVKLLNDTSASAVVSRAVKFTLDKNSKSFTGAITAGSGYELSVDGNVYTFTVRSSSGSSGSSSYDPTYSVSTPSKTENGSVTVSPKNASKGDTVTVTVKPDSGYVLETLTVTDKNGNELTLKDKGNGKYTFTMPAGKVEVKATFMEDNSMLNFFYDVPNNAYFYEAVKWAVKNGITTGVGNDLFAPEQPCTRAQIVTFLWRAAGSPEPKGAASGMTDVVSGSYYEKAVAWAIENGITTGTTTSTFSPDATCTRAQAVTFLARALKAKAASAAEFSDVPTGSYFADAVAWAAANGVTEGIGGGLFGSDNDCTRGQIVTFLYRAYNK